MIYRKVRTNLSRTLSAIEQDKATSDDYVKCILADPQIAAYIVQAVVEEFKDMEIDEIIPCMGEPTVTLRFPERLGVKVQNTGSESVDEEDGKIIYDIKFPVYYKGKKKEFIINIEAQKSSKKSKLGYKLENRITYYMGRMISEKRAGFTSMWMWKWFVPLMNCWKIRHFLDLRQRIISIQALDLEQKQEMQL